MGLLPDRWAVAPRRRCGGALAGRELAGRGHRRRSRGLRVGVASLTQGLESACFALPSFAGDPLVGDRAERADQVLGRIGQYAVEVLFDMSAPRPGGRVERGGFERSGAADRRRRGGRRCVAASERPAVGQVDGEPQGRVERGADARVSLAVVGDPLRVAVDAVLVGAVGAEVLARDVDGVAVDRAGVADVGLLLGLRPVAGERCGAADGRALGGEAVQRVVQPDGGGAVAYAVLCAQLRLVDLDQSGLGAGLAQQEGERVALGVDGFDDRGLTVLDPLGPRPAGVAREGVGGVADRDDVARAEQVVAVDRTDRLFAELAGVEALLLGELVDQIDVASWGRGRSAPTPSARSRGASGPTPRPSRPSPARGCRRAGASLLLEDRDRVETAALVNGDLVVAQPRVNAVRGCRGRGAGGSGAAPPWGSALRRAFRRTGRGGGSRRAVRRGRRRGRWRRGARPRWASSAQWPVSSFEASSTKITVRSSTSIAPVWRRTLSCSTVSAGAFAAELLGHPSGGGAVHRARDHPPARRPVRLGGGVQRGAFAGPRPAGQARPPGAAGEQLERLALLRGRDACPRRALPLRPAKPGFPLRPTDRRAAWFPSPPP